ncbi:hypothetical protein Tco_1030230 [Tanacetum coccineum]|uniref:Uncharacterized protein n=1 Tax=Tanacetum coccineum TaxID=301880 RepID=A0ABQ5G5S8_9ASTR
MEKIRKSRGLGWRTIMKIVNGLVANFIMGRTSKKRHQSRDDVLYGICASAYTLGWQRTKIDRALILGKVDDTRAILSTQDIDELVVVGESLIEEVVRSLLYFHLIV